LSNIDLYKSEYRFRKLVGSDILFNAKSSFVSVKHNRVSFPILETGSDRTGFRVDNVRNFLFLSLSSFGIRDQDDWETDTNFSSCFVLSELLLVDQIPNV